jgi:hypothetical protein
MLARLRQWSVEAEGQPVLHRKRAGKAVNAFMAEEFRLTKAVSRIAHYGLRGAASAPSFFVGGYDVYHGLERWAVKKEGGGTQVVRVA